MFFNALQLQFLPNFADAIGDFLEIVHAIDIDDVAGLQIVFFALGELFANEVEGFFRRLFEQERTNALAERQMVLQHFGRGFQVDGFGLLVHIRHVVEETGRSASAGDDDVLEFSDLVQHIVLDLAKTFLALLVENLLHGLAHPRGNIPVEVVERDAERLGEFLADGGLAGSHVTDNNDSNHIQPVKISSQSSWPPRS